MNRRLPRLTVLTIIMMFAVLSCIAVVASAGIKDAESGDVEASKPDSVQFAESAGVEAAKTAGAVEVKETDNAEHSIYYLTDIEEEYTFVIKSTAVDSEGNVFAAVSIFPKLEYTVRNTGSKDFYYINAVFRRVTDSEWVKELGDNNGAFGFLRVTDGKIYYVYSDSPVK